MRCPRLRPATMSCRQTMVISKRSGGAAAGIVGIGVGTGGAGDGGRYRGCQMLQSSAISRQWRD